jgi:cytochrome c oxidase cbb3-type subunit 2
LIDPRGVVPESIMPPYSFIAERPLQTDDIVDRIEANIAVGVPYDPEMVENAMADLYAQADPFADHDDLLARYPKAVVGDLDGDPSRLTEMDALVAYLQILGRMVDFADTAVEDLEAAR